MDIVRDGSTGVLFRDPTAHAIVDAAARAPAGADRACRANAERFSEERFDREFLEFVESIFARVAPASSPR
jgi:hypothetical protein